MTLLFIFDMDDVLYDYDWRIRMEGMTSITGYSLTELRDRWWHRDGEWAAEAGDFATAEEYLAAHEKALGITVDIDQWIGFRRQAMTPWPESIDAVRRAAELGQVTLLTNNGALISRHLRALAPEIADIFGDHLHTSSDYFARKPDPVVYERVLEAYQTAPEDAFFADDRKDNVDGAAGVGIHAHLFETSRGMRDAIEAFAHSRSNALR